MVACVFSRWVVFCACFRMKPSELQLRSPLVKYASGCIKHTLESKQDLPRWTSAAPGSAVANSMRWSKKSFFFPFFEMLFWYCFDTSLYIAFKNFRVCQTSSRLDPRPSEFRVLLHNERTVQKNIKSIRSERSSEEPLQRGEPCIFEDWVVSNAAHPGEWVVLLPDRLK